MRLTAFALSLALALPLCAQTSSHWTPLKEGNDAFQGKKISFDKLIDVRDGLVDGQYPPVTVLSCSDSRVPPELIFKQTMGKIFLVRSAGNVTDTDGIASIEYALGPKPGVRWTKLLVILAHEKCGAVESAIATDTHPSPNLTALLRQIRASFSEGCPKETNACLMFRTKENAIHAVDDLKEHSAIIKHAIEVDKLPVVIGYYELKSGKVVVWKTINN